MGEIYVYKIFIPARKMLLGNPALDIMIILKENLKLLLCVNVAQI
jgi:hypothetical protein